MLLLSRSPQKPTLLKSIDYVVLAAIVWVSISLANSFFAMRGMSFLEKMYFSCANSYVFFSGIGMSCIILLASRFMSQKVEESIIQVIKRWISSCTCVCCVSVILVCAFALTCTEMAYDWSNSATVMSYTNTAQFIEVPLLPAIIELMDTITPLQASLFQLILVYLCIVLYGLIYSLVLKLANNRMLAIVSIYVFHIIGQYTIDAWPQWAAAIPHSYFFLQYYGEWNPFPLFSVYSGAIRIVIMLFLTVSAILLLNKIKASNSVRKS